MVPHDQQLEVASPGMTSDDFGSAFAIENLRRAHGPPPHYSLFVRGQSARATLYAENELPQPQDFFEFGLTNTKPCCISVSW